MSSRVLREKESIIARRYTFKANLLPCLEKGLQAIHWRASATRRRGVGAWVELARWQVSSQVSTSFKKKKACCLYFSKFPPKRHVPISRIASPANQAISRAKNGYCSFGQSKIMTSTYSAYLNLNPAEIRFFLNEFYDFEAPEKNKSTTRRRGGLSTCLRIGAFIGLYGQ